MSHPMKARPIILIATARDAVSSATATAADTPVPFDYAGFTPDVRDELQEQKRALQELTHHDVAGLIETGRRLLAARHLLGSHRFQPWLKSETRLSQSSISKSLRIAAVFPELEFPDRFHRGALYALARAQVPAAVRRQALELARTGITVDMRAVRALLAPGRASRGTPAELILGQFSRFRQRIRRSRCYLSAQEIESLCRELESVQAELRSPIEDPPRRSRAARKPDDNYSARNIFAAADP